MAKKGRPRKNQLLRTTLLYEQIKCLLLDSRRLTQKQIAEIVDCHPSVVAKVSSELHKSYNNAMELLRDYQVRIGEMYGVDQRVERLLEIVKDKKRPDLSFRAIQYLDRLTGVASAVKQQGEVPEKKPQPMFVLPDGTNLSLKVDRRTVDVTPEKSPED